MEENKNIDKIPGYFENIPVMYHTGSIAYDETTGTSVNEGEGFCFRESDFYKYEEYVFLSRQDAISVLATSLESAYQQLRRDFSIPINPLDESFVVIKLENRLIGEAVFRRDWKNKIEEIYKLVF